MAKVLGIPFIDIDVAIELEEQAAINEIFETHGEKYFRELEAKSLKEFTNVHAVIATGGGLPCHSGNMEIMLNKGICVYLNLPVKALVSRLESAKYTRPLIADKSGIELEKFIEKGLKEREVFYKKAQIEVDGISLNNPEKITELADKIKAAYIK